MGEGRGWADLQRPWGRPGMMQANSFFKIIMTKTEEEGREGIREEALTTPSNPWGT